MEQAHEYARRLLDELYDDANHNTKDLSPCGSEVIEHFLHVVKAIFDRALPVTSSILLLDALIEDAYAQLSSSKRPLLCWCRLFTDACIWRTLAEVLLATAAIPEPTASACVACLDRAIIVAGPCGDGRLDLIHDLISLIQSTYLGFHPPPAGSVTYQPSSPSTSYIELPRTYTKAIPRLDTPPSFAAFVSRYSKHPFIVPGYVKDWPALTGHPWSSQGYLRSLAGPGRVVPIEVGADYRTDDWTQTMMSWDDFLSAIFSPDEPSENKRLVLYLAQHNLFRQFPALRDDMLIPDYVYASLSPSEDYPQYNPPQNEEQLVVNAWLGPKGTVSPAHIVSEWHLNLCVSAENPVKDPFHNFFAQVVGRKVVWIAPPTISSSMYTYSSPSSTSNCQHYNPASNKFDPSLSNTTRVDVFSDNQEAFPLFRDNVIPEAMAAIVEPGDLLFLPVGWWHAMRSEDVSFSVTMWF